MTRCETLINGATRVTIKRMRRSATIEYGEADVTRLYNLQKVLLNELALTCANNGLWPIHNNRCIEVWIKR